jgi:hypothetical protein
VRDKCGNGILSTGVRINIDIDDSSLRWSLHTKERTGAEERGVIIDAPATVAVGLIHVGLTATYSPPPLLDRVAEWLSERILDSFKGPLNAVVSGKGYDPVDPCYHYYE